MTRRHALLFALALLAPLAAGCMTDGDAATPAAAAVPAAPAAGGSGGAAPVAPKEAYAVDASRTAYPVPVETTPARAPVVVDFSGEFRPSDCRPLNFGSLEQQLAAASHPMRRRDLSDVLQVGDVFAYNITLSFVNAQQNWAEVALVYGLGSTIRENDEPTQGKEQVVVSFEGQGMRASKDDLAWLFVACRYGVMTSAIPYTLTVTFSFAEGAVPAEAPMLLRVPEGATRLFVRGVPVDEARGVLSHFRVFRPDDTLLCECALGSRDAVTELAIPAPGDYVLIVDHTDNGFVSVALDAPAPAPLRPLAAEWVQVPVLASDRGAVDERVDIHLDRVPLFMFAHVAQKDAVGVGKRTSLSVTNERGEPLRIGWGGHLAWTFPMFGNAWLGFWPGDWEFVVDHHAFAQGHHTAHVSADELRGEVFLMVRQYVR